MIANLRWVVLGCLVILCASCTTSSTKKDDNFSREIVSGPPVGQESQFQPLPAGPAVLIKNASVQTRQSAPLIVTTSDGYVEHISVLAQEPFERFLSYGPAYALRWVDLKPVHREDIFYGYELTSLDPSVNGTIGLPLSVGDIIIAVQQTKIREPSDLYTIWETLADTENVELTFERDGQPYRYIWTISAVSQ